MSVGMHADKGINKIIAKSFDLLRFRAVFKDYDEYRSQSREYLDVILHTNELQQLRENIYYKQTTDNLKTHYADIFDGIAEITLTLKGNQNKTSKVYELKEKVSELDFSPPYLQEKVFDLNSKCSSTAMRQAQKNRSHYQFILAKARVKVAIKQYLREPQYMMDIC